MVRRFGIILLALAFGSPWCCCFGAAAMAEVMEPPPMTCCGQPLEADESAAPQPAVPHDCPHAVARDHQQADLHTVELSPVALPLLAIVSVASHTIPVHQPVTAAFDPRTHAPPLSPPERCARFAVFLL